MSVAAVATPLQKIFNRARRLRERAMLHYQTSAQ